MIFFLSQIHHVVPELTGGEHSRLQHASNKIDIQSSEELGNFAVASEDLKTGDTIITEKPIAACLLPKYFGSHCLNCLRRFDFTCAYRHPNVIFYQSFSAAMYAVQP